MTTHRIVFTSSAGHNASIKSFSAPFFAMSGLSLEQPIFGANSIKGKVSGPQEFTFELKFNKGGATEFAQAMRNAAKQAQTNSQQSGYQPPPAYSSTPDPSSYYQTPVDNVYQPNYPVGFVLPTQQFSQAPPPGFIYACDVPPPYPGKFHRHRESVTNGCTFDFLMTNLSLFSLFSFSQELFQPLPHLPLWVILEWAQPAWVLL